MRLPSQEDLLGSGDAGGDEEEMDEEAWAAQEAERERRACRSSADSQPLIDFSNVATLHFGPERSLTALHIPGARRKKH